MLQYCKISVGLITGLLSISPIAQAEQALPPPIELNNLERASSPNHRSDQKLFQVKPAPNSVSQTAPSTSLPVCPAGQFPSKFPDVTPRDWAYQAVNQLAVGEYRCYPFPRRS